MHKMQLTSLSLATVLLLVLFQFSLSQRQRSGSFFYAREPVPEVFRLGLRYPDRNETDQCRPIRLRITRNSRLYISDLVTNTNPKIIFHSADARVMTSRLQSRLNGLAKRFLVRTSKKIKVLKAWSEYAANDSDPDSLHYEGRTVRVYVWRKYVSYLLQLAVEVGFDWVVYDSLDYVRLSVIPDACSGKIDIVFMLDQSGSVGARNHDIALRFIHDVVSFYNISTNQTRMGMVTFSTGARLEFTLNAHKNLTSLQHSIGRIPYRGGWTATAWALFFARVMLQHDEGYGARPDSEGVPKIAVLITDGRSNLYPIAEYATDLRNRVQVFTVGIGNIFLPELLTIASDPDRDHVFRLRSFTDAPYFVDFLSFTACDAPAIVDPGENTTTDVEEDHFRYFQSFCPAFSQTVMIEQIDIIGTCSLYASAYVSNPGPIHPSNLVVRNENRRGHKRSVTLHPSKNMYIYIAVRGLTLRNTFSVIIWDMIFEQDEYNISVYAGITVSLLFNLTKVLQTSNVTFNFTITEGNRYGYFSVGLQSGIVELIHPLNANHNEYFLTIVGQNSQFSCHRGTVLLRITVHNNIELPNLDPAHISENATRGSVVTQVQVLGRSLGISYSLGAGNTGNVFAIDSTTGIITVYGTLNFEVQRSYNLTVTATSYGLPGTLRTVSTIQEVQVLDINETPTFTSACAFSSTGVTVCTFTVMENDPDTTTLGPLTGEDPDLFTVPNGQVTFSLVAILPATGFHLIQIDETVTIVKNETFDREQSSSFSLTVRITDRGSPPLSSNLAVRIHVADVNDNAPMFVQAPPLFSISESTAVGTNIAQYQATDRDSGVNAEISYNLTSVVSLDTPFEINPINGYLRVSLPLDFEAVQSYFLRIIASNPDGLRVETSTTITILDVNDNAPLFSQVVYNASVSEGDPVRTFVLLVEATDGDFGKDAFNFSIRDGNFNNSFVINDGTISLSSEVDREAIPMFNLTISVTDFGVPRLSSFATVLIRVSDINDNPPIFTKARYEIPIREDVESVNVITVTAFDSDEPFSPNSMIIFSLIQGGNIGGVFNLTQIDNNNSVLRLIGKLDFENLEMYELRIIATDQGSPSLSSETIVVINVTDINELPTLTENTTINIPESAPPGFKFIQVNISGFNIMEVKFTILSVSDSGASGNSGRLFDINSGGVASTREQLDFESMQTFIITIQVADRNRRSIIYLTINIIDENESPPTFQVVGNFSVLEEEPIGTFVGKVKAVDGDTGPMSGVTYSIMPDSKVAFLFRIDSQRGNISTAKVLDREQLVEQNLFLPSRGSSDVITVVATDTQVPFRSSMATVTITLVDINDNSPIIQSFLEPLSIPENEMEGELLVGIVARDRDIGSNGEINFILTVLEPITPLGEAVPFVINNSGDFTTNVVLDREARSTYGLSLRAADEGRPPNSSPEVRFVVGVTDVNDNAPVFSNDAYEVSVPENVALITTILIVSATDADISTTSPQISFVIISSNPPNSTGVFSIRSTDQVTVEMPLDFESVQTYFLVIEAVDSGTPAMFTRANLTIRVENVDEAPPIFVKICSVTIVENNVQPGLAIEQCFAVDIDENTGEPIFASPLVYRIISGNLKNTFSIRGSGSVILERSIDREEIDFYSLLIQVTNPDDFSATTFVNVTISDANDNTPIITNQDLFLNVDSSDIRSGVVNFFTVTAMDADTGDNAKLIYVLNNFTVSVNGMQVTISVTVSDSGAPPLSSSVIITLDFETPCFLQNHIINPTNGVSTSYLLCNAILDPADVDVIFGGALELMCSVPLSNIQPTSFEFHHNNSVVSAMESNLTIRNVTFETGGEYTCKVMSDIGSLQSDNWLVRIVVRPEVVLALMDILVQDGRRTTIECLAIGVPEPTITWERTLESTGVREEVVDNPTDRFFVEGGIMIIAPTLSGDQGIYSCNVSNSVGVVSSVFVLAVFQRSSIVQVEMMSFSNLSISAGRMCHDANQQHFETTLQEITGVGTAVTNQNGDDLCDNTPCSSTPCRNDGVCTLKNTNSTGFECTCSAGYTGINCEIDIDECSEDPCQFGGTCVNTPPGSFTCSCPQGTTGHRCLLQDVCSSTTCPPNQTCVLTLTNTAGFICQNLAQENAGLVRVITRGETSALALGTLEDQVNTFQENNENSNSSNSNSNMENSGKRRKRMTENDDIIINNGLVTACEAKFIPDPNFIQEDELVLVLVWACPEGVLPPSVDRLDAICMFLYTSKSITSCTSPSGMTLPTSLVDLPNTTLTFSFVLLDSNKFPLSGEEALTLLRDTDALNKLRAQGYQATEFVLVSGPSTPTLHEDGGSVGMIVGVTVGVVLVMVAIIFIVALTLCSRSKQQKRRRVPMSDDAPQKLEYHLDRNGSRKYPTEFSPLPLQRVSNNSELFDDTIYMTGYIPPKCTTTAMQPKAENLGRKLHKKNNALKRSLTKRTESTDELLPNINIDYSEVVSHDQAHVNLGTPPLPPRDKLFTRPVQNLDICASGIYANEEHIHLGAMGNAGTRWESYHKTATLLRNHDD